MTKPILTLLVAAALAGSTGAAFAQAAGQDSAGSVAKSTGQAGQPTSSTPPDPAGGGATTEPPAPAGTDSAHSVAKNKGTVGHKGRHSRPPHPAETGGSMQQPAAEQGAGTAAPGQAGAPSVANQRGGTDTGTTDAPPK